MSEWARPEVSVGDFCLFYDNPSNPQNPSMGFVVERPGAQTVSLLIFSPSSGWVEKKSVRHADDPFWHESDSAPQWQRWGCFRLHPITELIPHMKEMVVDWKIAKAKRQASKQAAAAE